MIGYGARRNLLELLYMAVVPVGSDADRALVKRQTVIRFQVDLVGEYLNVIFTASSCHSMPP